jgi:hypothetical protein
MSEQTHISANIPTSPACGQWETLLTDALDGLLQAEDQTFFSEHMATCPYCTELYEDAKRGREWLDFLETAPEMPDGLMEKILAQTGPGVDPGQTAGFGIFGGQIQAATAGGVMAYPGSRLGPQAWQKPGFMGFVRRFAEPRLMMTAAMAFFSIFLTLNLTGVKLKDLNLRPQAVRSYMERQIAVVSTPVVRYYDHLRLVYEVQTRMKELRRSTENGQQPGAPNGESKQAPGHKDGGSRLDYGSDPMPEAPQQSVTPAYDDANYLETSLPLHGRAAHSGGSTKKAERSARWIA